MIGLDALVTWHKGLALPIEFGWFVGPRAREFGQGDNVGLVTPTTSPGSDLEDIGDWFGFQVRLTGREYQNAALYESAMTVDTALRYLGLPATLWGTWIRAIIRAGGPPDVVQDDEHDRISFVGNYLAHELI